jgi:uncharacterized membrane protein
MSPKPSSSASSSSVRSPWYTSDAHHRLALSAVAAGLGGWLMRGHLAGPTLAVATWDLFAAFSMALAWSVIVSQDPFETRRTAQLEDASRTFLFVMVVSAAVASLFAVALMLGEAKGLPRPKLAGHIGLSVAAVVLSWALIHTVFALRYAHHYYDGAKDKPRDEVAGGLVFPDEPNPDYLDFAYFAFVIGMTCQVSDVQISGRGLRRIALWHGLIAFVFNTAILALFVNIVAGLI